MPSFPCVHHVEVGVTDGPRAVSILRANYTFDVVAARNSKVARQWLLVKNDTRYLVTSLKTDQKEQIEKDDYVIDWMNGSSKDSRNSFMKEQRKDSVFNVCLQVDSIEQSLKRLEEYGVRPFRNVRTISDSFGSVRIGTIKSCVGDVYHTLVEKTNYNGLFLPGFRQIKCACDPVKDDFWSAQDERLSNSCNICSKNICDKEKSEYSQEHFRDIEDSVPATSFPNSLQSSQDLGSNCPIWTTFDHVAFAVEIGQSDEVIGWYENCLGMRRFQINSEEDTDEGLVLNMDNVKLRLRAMEYWKCAETGLAGPKDDVRGSRLSIVIAEGLPSLPGSGEESQIELWMRQHGGPGIQHIALSTEDIKATVGRLRNFGATFANAPPQAYYTEVGRLYDIEKAGEDLEALRQNGILIDTEADSISNGGGEGNGINGNSENNQERYLLQIFTRPIFPKDPFFMEIIQRSGATGFGSGNVAALYRSMQACIVDNSKDMNR